jgi:hypothetical protein
LDSLIPAGTNRSYEPVILSDFAGSCVNDGSRIAAASAVVFPSSRPPPDLAIEAAGWEFRTRRRRRHAMMVVVASSLSGGVLGALYRLLAL